MPVRDALAVLTDGVDALPAGRVLVHDPVGGPIGIAVAEWLAAAGRSVALVTQDPIAGQLLSMTGDLADANTRLQRSGVSRELRALLRAINGDCVVLEDVWTGEQREIRCDVIVDAGPAWRRSRFASRGLAHCALETQWRRAESSTPCSKGGAVRWMWKRA